LFFNYKYLFIQTVVGHLLLYIGLLVVFFKAVIKQKQSFM